MRGRLAAKGMHRWLHTFKLTSGTGYPWLTRALHCSNPLHAHSGPHSTKSTAHPVLRPTQHQVHIRPTQHQVHSSSRVAAHTAPSTHPAHTAPSPQLIPSCVCAPHLHMHASAQSTHPPPTQALPACTACWTRCSPATAQPRRSCWQTWPRGARGSACYQCPLRSADRW